ncbi:hypothetical protein P1J78_13755 [Psychromarinibacter sp. C21-152]|uniref:Uncharacterized protein n=2 Tax=Psychromarinibacter sediminicola TaxID=3033385 RepID=A0AAE3NSU8_9RHOB|nr:hypothetical protein [Psychromarinibacter sediminicola]
MSFLLLTRHTGAQLVGVGDGPAAAGDTGAADETRIEPGLEERVAAIMRALGGDGTGEDGTGVGSAAEGGAGDGGVVETGAKAAELPVIESFDASRDVIVVELPEGLSLSPEIAVRQDGDSSIVSIDGIDLARIRGAGPDAEEALRLVID